MMMLFAIATSCSDKDVDLSGGNALPEGSEWVINAACNDYTYILKTDKSWKAEIEDEWAVLECKTGQGNKELKIFAEENMEDESRSTTMHITLDDGNVVSVIIRQKGVAESGDNAKSESGYQKHGVCFGYNGYGKYADANYIAGQIINEQKAKELMNEYAEGEASVQLESYEVIENIESTGTSSEDMSESLGINASLNVSLPCGFALDIKADYNSEDLAQSSKNFSKRRHKRILLRKTMSVENLIGLMEELEYEGVKNNIFTTGFRSVLRKLTLAVKSGDAVKANKSLKDFIEKFGTHIVVASELGGCFDYSMVTDKSDISSKTDIAAGLDMGYKKMFNIKGDASYDKLNKKIGSNYSCKVTVLGGDASILSAATNGQMDNTNEDIEKWERSITEDNSLMIDHKLIPIWNIIPNDTVAEAVEQYLTTGEYIKVNQQLTLPEPVQDITGSIKVVLKDFMEEVNEGSKTLVYTVDAAGSPVAEICHELIPAIGNKRVFVAYPLIAGKPDYSEGFFLGNGVRKPGSVKWNEEDYTYYYTGDSRYSDGDIIDTLYIEGTGSGMDFSGKINPVVKKYATGYMQPAYANFYKYFPGSTQTKLAGYSIVKIGKQVWTRENIASPYGVGYKKFTQVNQDGNFFYQWSDNFLKTQWSVPTSKSFKQMQSISPTGKPFIKGGSTGFDLDVLGCYSVKEKRIIIWYNWFRYIYGTSTSTEKDDRETYFLRTADRKVIGIDKDGLEKMFEMNEDTGMYYPVRFIRSDNFQYE